MSPITLTARVGMWVDRRTRFDVAREGLPATVSHMVASNPSASSDIVKILAAHGILKYREAQRLQAAENIAEEVKNLSLADFSWGISHRRYDSALGQIGALKQTDPTKAPEILKFQEIEEVKLGLSAKIANTATDVAWGIQRVLLAAEEASGKPSAAEHKSVFLTAGTSLKKKVALGLLAAFSMGTLTACNQAPLWSSLATGTAKVGLAAAGIALGLPLLQSLLLGSLGVAGIVALVKLGKYIITSPAFRDTAGRAFFPIAVSILSYAIRAAAGGIIDTYLPGHSVLAGLLAMVAQWGSVLALEGIRFGLSYILPFRVGSFGREAPFYRKARLENDPEIRKHIQKRDHVFDILKNSKMLTNIPKELRALCGGTDADIDDLERKLNADPTAAKNILEDYHIAHTRAIPDIKVADGVSVVGSRFSRLLSWNYLPYILLPYTAGGFSWINAFIYTIFALSSVYYHIGTAWSMKMIESAEYVENTGLPRFADNVRPVVTVVRYSNKGLMDRKGITPAYMIADIENRIEFGDYYVVFNNDANNHFTFQVFGGVKYAEKIEARMHYMLRNGVLDSLGLDEKDKMRLAFVLSCRNYEKNPMEIVDHAINHLYPAAPANGEAIRFRDGYTRWQKWIRKSKSMLAGRSKIRYANRSIGDGGGENSCFAALASLVETLPVSDSDRIIKYLKHLIVRENRLDLLGIQKKEEVEKVLESLHTRFGVSREDRDFIIGALDRLDDILLQSLMKTAQKAGMDEHRAYGVAREIVRRSKQAVAWSKIAEVGNYLMLGLQTSPEKVAEFEEALTESFKISDPARVTNTIKEQAKTIEEQSDQLAQVAQVPKPLFFRMMRYSQVMLSLFRNGRAVADEGNMIRRYQYLSTAIAPAEREEYKFLTDAYVGKFRDMYEKTDKITRADLKKSIDKMVKHGMMLISERGLPWVSEENLREMLEEFTRAKNPEVPADEAILRLLNELVVFSVIGVERSFWGRNANLELLIARRIQDVLINRGWLALGTRKLRRKRLDNLVRMIGVTVAKKAASIQPGMADYEAAAAANPGLSIEAVHKAVWNKFLEKLNMAVDETVRELVKNDGILPFLRRKELEDLIALAQEISAAEFTENNNNVFRIAYGMANQWTAEVQGIQQLQGLLGAGREAERELVDVYDARERCRKLNERRQAAIGKIRGMLDMGRMTPEQGEAALGQLVADVRTVIESGVGDRNKHKGYSLIYWRLHHFFPSVFFGKQLTLKHHEPGVIRKTRKIELVVYDPATEKIKSKEDLKIDAEYDDQVIAQLDELVLAEIEERRITRDLQMWAYAAGSAQESKDIERNERTRTHHRIVHTCSKAASFQVAKHIVDTLIKDPSAAIVLDGTKLINGMIGSTSGGDLGGEREAILKEINNGLKSPSTDPKAVSIPKRDPGRDGRDGFAPVYNFNRLFGEWWHKGKDVNTNLEFLGARVYEQVGVQLRFIIKSMFTELQGLYRVPIHLSEKIKIEVSEQLRFHTAREDDFDFKLKHGLTHEDIARKLFEKISGGRSSFNAAKELWADISRALDENNGNGWKITRDYSRVSSLSALRDIRKNLEDCARETMILYQQGRLLEILDDGQPEPLKRALAEIERLNIPEGGELKRFIKEEYRVAVKDKKLRERILEARQKGEVELALALEQRLTYRGDSRKSVQYRHKTKRPESLTGKARTLTELADWITTMQRGAEYTIEAGELLEDAALLRKSAVMGDKLLKLIEARKTLDEIKRAFNITDGSIDTYLNDLIADCANLRHSLRTQIQTFSRDDGRALEKRIDAFTFVLSKILQQREGYSRKARANNTYQNFDSKSETERIDLDKIVFINPLDERRFPRTVMEEVKTDLQMNADTDNIFYTELLDAASHFGYRSGAWTHPNEVAQYGLNYETVSRGKMLRFHRERDLGGPQNKAALWSSGTTGGKVRHRAALIEFAGTLTGYANLFPLHVGMQAAEYVLEYNNATTGYYGHRAIGRVLKWLHIGNETDWEKKSDPFQKHRYTGADRIMYLLNRNPLNIAMGWDDGWDAAAAAERWLRVIPMVSFAGLFLGKVINLVWGTFVDGGTEFSPSPVNIGGMEMSTLTLVGGGSLLAWLFAKGIARAIGRKILRYQMYRGRRLYVIDPSEDLATSMPLRIKGFKLTMLKGGRELNDATYDWEGEMFQKLRWQAQNAANFTRVLKYCWDYRKVLSFKESFDLVQAPLYNMFGIPGIFNRFAILAFVLMAEPTVLINKTYTFLQDNLKWLVEIGLLNYATIEFMLRYSRMRAGATWGGIGMNFAYETTMLEFNYTNVGRRAFSRTKAAFNVTDPQGFCAQVDTWGISNPTTNFLMRNKFVIGLELYALYRIFGGHMVDAMKNLDFWEFYMGTLAFWIGLKIYYNIRGQFLNGGVSSISTEEKWEKGSWGTSKWERRKNSWSDSFGYGYANPVNYALRYAA